MGLLLILPQATQISVLLSEMLAFQSAALARLATISQKRGARASEIWRFRKREAKKLSKLGTILTRRITEALRKVKN